MNTEHPRTIDAYTQNEAPDARKVPVDLAHLRRYTFGDKALEAEVLNLFLDQLPETIAAMRSAATERDWKIAAHTLKGSSRAVGAWQIAALAEAAEVLAQRAEPSEKADALAKLEAAASEAKAFVIKTAGAA